MNLKNKNLILSAITLLSVFYSALNLAVLAFINRYLLNITSGEYGLILYFIILLLLFFIASLAFRYTISLASQNYIYDMRLSIIKRILDTDYHHTRQIGRAKLIALLSSDIASITNGFVRIPEILQGGLVAIVSFFYILYGWDLGLSCVCILSKNYIIFLSSIEKMRIDSTKIMKHL
ncbi:ABC transporter transmembrane domain-containing protein [Campylobacter fetus]|uniref:ABC transporter transmembrane domain-containing protein n=1 Tax=Campylobacter fetus TaxID=196 RepID=UPI003AF8F30C